MRSRRAGPTGFSGRGGSWARRSRGWPSAARVPARRARAGVALTHRPPGPARRPRLPAWRPRRSWGPLSARAGGARRWPTAAPSCQGRGAPGSRRGGWRDPGPSGPPGEDRSPRSPAGSAHGRREGRAGHAHQCPSHFKGSVVGGGGGERKESGTRGRRGRAGRFLVLRPVGLLPEGREGSLEPRPPPSSRGGGPHPDATHPTLCGGWGCTVLPLLCSPPHKSLGPSRHTAPSPQRPPPRSAPAWPLESPGEVGGPTSRPPETSLQQSCLTLTLIGG